MLTFISSLAFLSLSKNTPSIEPGLQVWPYLLGHYVFGSTAEDRRALDATTRQNYETTMSEWLAVEAIVRQRDKETMAANLAKLSSESTSGEAPPPTPNLQHDLSNDVSGRSAETPLRARQSVALHLPLLIAHPSAAGVRGQRQPLRR